MISQNYIVLKMKFRCLHMVTIPVNIQFLCNNTSTVSPDLLYLNWYPKHVSQVRNLMEFFLLYS